MIGAISFLRFRMQRQGELVMLVKQPLRVILVTMLAVSLIILPTLLSMRANKLETIATAQTSNSLPQGYIGVWRGSGIQVNTSMEWS
jgi:hypothetical protein